MNNTAPSSATVI